MEEKEIRENPEFNFDNPVYIVFSLGDDSIPFPEAAFSTMAKAAAYIERASKTSSTPREIKILFVDLRDQEDQENRK